jgi:GNAT superfamily N-acetyltransferase
MSENEEAIILTEDQSEERPYEFVLHENAREQEVLGAIVRTATGSNLSAKESLVAAVNRETGELLGFVGVKRRSFHLSEIRHLHVDKPNRNQGIATNLVKKALEMVKTPVVFATVSYQNIPSYKTFMVNGFTEWTQFPSSSSGKIMCLVGRHVVRLQ